MLALRDILLTGGILASLPFCFMRPWIGILVWTWFGVMTPHKLTWGFSYDYPFAELIAVATMAGVPFARDRRPLPRTRETYILLAFWLLVSITTLLAFYPGEAFELWKKLSKILLFTFIGLVFLQERARLRALALVIALSIGFFGLKGGIWALLTGGANRVEAPEGSFIGGNTGLALGLDIGLPLFFYLARDTSLPWLRRLFWVIFVASIPAVVFTYSRGGLLGLGVVLLFLAIKSNRRVLALSMFAVALVGVLTVAPAGWFERANTIVNYEDDGSAMGRLLAWRLAFVFALDHPVFGGGFGVIGHEEIYLKYANVKGSAIPHSIWFSALSEHGFPGLTLFAGLIVSCILTLRRLRRTVGGKSPPAPWIVNYSHMLEVSIVGYATAGSFLSATYIDIFYWLVALVILLAVVAAREGALEPPPAPEARRALPTRVFKAIGAR